ncbi:hypothetical protein [Okeania sp.]|uniref:hypothetical protein n=1 Tax=Okeania sp. TaxID=3100323 RepID=UPI002B4ADC75|nr:hypothetical protein [Okeania sp.]MEB3342181.1 hypothetical protein [Okeania sp.]
MSLNYRVKEEDIEKLENVRKSLYVRIFESLKNWKSAGVVGQLSKPKLELVLYKDKPYYQRDKQRLYIEFRYKSVRETNITILFRCYVHSNNLYIAVDSYLLGRLQIIIFCMHNFFLLFIFMTLFSLGIPFLILGLIVLIPYANWIWTKIIKALRQGEGFLTSLRQRFHKPISDNSFDVDDKSIILKAIFSLILQATKNAFKENNFAVEGLDEKLDELINNASNQTFNIVAEGGISGAIFGGTSNKVVN